MQTLRHHCVYVAPHAAPHDEPLQNVVRRVDASVSGDCLVGDDDQPRLNSFAHGALKSPTCGIFEDPGDFNVS